MRYPITLKRAKEIAKEKLGRYPRMGYEVPVTSYPVKVQGFPFEGKSLVTRTATLYLVNESGRFRLFEYVPVNPD